jgi:hypothetical protein
MKYNFTRRDDAIMQLFDSAAQLVELNELSSVDDDNARK